MNQDLKSLLILNRLPGFGVQTLKTQLEISATPGAVLRALKEGGNAIWRDEIERMLDAREAEKEFEQCSQIGVQILGYGLAGYPKSLLNIYDPPLVLYVSGDLPPEDVFCFAIVGTREPSPYGIETTRRFASVLASAGITIVSGFARGIDSEAHRGALAAQGKTLAVLGCGLDVIYPAENKALCQQIREQGALVSEYPLGTPPLAPNFPRRNRLISGFSMGVLVVEAHEKSGSLITASLALEQGKEVFAIPGRIDSLRSKGTNRLIKQGACLAQTPDDILTELHFVLEGYLRAVSKPVADEPLFSQDPVIEALQLSPLSSEELTEKMGMEAEKVMSLLTLLEVKGQVVRRQDGRYQVSDKKGVKIKI